MSIIQVIIDRTTSMMIEGVYQFNRSSNGTLIAPSGSSFPVTPVAGEWFWRTDEAQLYRRNDANTTWEAVGSGGLGYLTAATHAQLRQLIHFIDEGPAEGFASGAYRETTGTIFPTQVVWYDSSGPGKKKIVEKIISWTGPVPTQIVWNMYDDTETLTATVTDTISYSGLFETSRTRTIT